MQVTLEQGDYGGTYLLVAEDGRDVLIQVDFDYPSIASNLGWSPTSVQQLARDDEYCMAMHPQLHLPEIGCPPPCEHSGTDGTVDCKRCGLKAIDFINSAQEYLDNHVGESFEDPGYFDEEDCLDESFPDDDGEEDLPTLRNNLHNAMMAFKRIT